MLRTLAAAALATSVVAVAAPAQAQDDGRPMGLRFELGWNENFNLATYGSSDFRVVMDVGGDAPVDLTALAAAGIGNLSPNGVIKIGYDLGQFTPLIGLSFANRSVGPDDFSTTITAFVLDIEARYYLKPHRKGLQPFVFGEFNNGFAWVSTDAENDDELEDALGDSLDWTEVNAGLGMEYKFDQQGFAIGGKWGLGLAWRGASEDSSGIDGGYGDTTVGTLGAIYAAWRI